MNENTPNNQNLPAQAHNPVQPTPQAQPEPVKVKTINTKAKKKTFLFPSVGQTVQAGSPEEASQKIKETGEYKTFISKGNNK